MMELERDYEKIIRTGIKITDISMVIIFLIGTGIILFGMNYLSDIPEARNNLVLFGGGFTLVFLLFMLLHRRYLNGKLKNFGFKKGSKK